MNPIDKLHLLAELPGEFCELNHGPDTRREDFPAVDYLVMPFGYTESEAEEVSVRDLVVPVCRECAEALLGEEWTLAYCFECCSSHWISRRHARLQYRHHVLWLRGCPHCTNKFGGLYFNDFKALTEAPMFLGRQEEVVAA